MGGGEGVVEEFLPQNTEQNVRKVAVSPDSTPSPLRNLRNR